METTNLFSNYSLEDTIAAELNNNLTIVNGLVSKTNISFKPDFYILGGAALIFHGLNYKATLDIDTANIISSNIKENVSEFIDDAASEVCLLPSNYKSRALRIREDLNNIEVYILALEDLLITKIHCGRRKDFIAIKETKIFERVNKELLRNIIDNELVSSDRERIVKGIKYFKQQVK